jgi:hypothetical protein
VRNAIRQPITRPVWQILLSWGLAVLMISGLLSVWIYRVQTQAAEERDRAQREQDKAMCQMIGVFLGGPDPVPGPEGERSRVVRAGMRHYQDVLRCTEFAGEAPATPRD